MLTKKEKQKKKMIMMMMLMMMVDRRKKSMGKIHVVVARVNRCMRLKKMSLYCG